MHKMKLILFGMEFALHVLWSMLGEMCAPARASVSRRSSARARTSVYQSPSGFYVALGRFLYHRHMLRISCTWSQSNRVVAGSPSPRSHVAFSLWTRRSPVDQSLAFEGWSRKESHYGSIIAIITTCLWPNARYGGASDRAVSRCG